MDKSVTTPTTAKPRLDALTVLRFGAAAWVIALHLQSRAPLDVPAWGHRFFANGAHAMTLFFVLSGTVLAYGYHGLRPTASDVIAFYQARFARIYVPYAVLHVLALLWVSPVTAKELSTAIYTNVLSALGLQAWFPYAEISGANTGTWSISAEFFFYALFPALLPLMAWLRVRWGALRVCSYLAALSGLLGFADYAYPNGFFVYILPLARLPEFMLGIVVGLELLGAPRGKLGNPVALALACVAAFLVSLNPALDYGLWIRAHLVVVPAFAWLIYELARWDQRRAAQPNLAWRTMIYLGECSYSLFLAHMLPLLFIDSTAGQNWRAAHWHGTVPWFWVAFYATSLVGAVGLHELVEKPARRALLRHWRKTPPAAAAVAVGTAGDVTGKS